MWHQCINASSLRLCRVLPVMQWINNSKQKSGTGSGFQKNRWVVNDYGILRPCSITPFSWSKCWYNLNNIYSFITKPFTCSNKFCNKCAPAIKRVCWVKPVATIASFEKLHTAAKQHLLEEKYESEKLSTVPWNHIKEENKNLTAQTKNRSQNHQHILLHILWQGLVLCRRSASLHTWNKIHKLCQMNYRGRIPKGFP